MILKYQFVFVLVAALTISISLAKDGKTSNMRVKIDDNQPTRRFYIDKTRSYLVISKQGLTVLVDGQDKTTYFLKHNSDEVLVLKDDFDASNDDIKKYLNPYVFQQDGIEAEYKKAQESNKATKLDLSNPEKEDTFIKAYEKIAKKILFRPNADYKGLLKRLDDSFKLIDNYLSKIYKSQKKKVFENDRFLDDYFEYETMIVMLLKKYKGGEKKLFEQPIKIDLDKVYKRQILPDGMFELVAEIGKNLDIKNSFPNTPLVDIVDLSKTIAVEQKQCQA